MSKKLTLSEIFQGNYQKTGIKEISLGSGQKNKITNIRVKYYKRICFPYSTPEIPVIAVISPQIFNKTRIDSSIVSRNILQWAQRKNVVYLILASTTEIPRFFKNFRHNTRIYLSISEFDGYYLENKIKSLIREKMQDKVSLHGVIFEVEGKGILLTGASGIGKTTAALDLIKKNNFWVADDIALIKKNKKDELIARGHTRIKNLVYTKKTGIVSINKLIGDRKVKNKIKLAAIIEVQRRDIISNCFTVGINEILRVKLPCLCVNMPLCSYFDKNLLQESLAKLTGVY